MGARNFIGFDVWWLIRTPLNFFFQYIHNLGVPSDWEFVDVYGLDPDLLMMVPRPVAAVMLLYPITEKVSQILLLHRALFWENLSLGVAAR